MRILHVVDSLERGGLEHVVCALACEQRRRGYDVEVYCLLRTGDLAHGLAEGGVQVHCGQKRRGPDLRVVRELGRLIRAGERGLFHTHSMMPNYYACGARMLSAPKATVVNTRHDMGSTVPGDLRERLYRFSMPLTHLAVMVSERVKERFIAAGIVPARKARVVLNAISTDRPQSTDPARREAARALLKASPEQFVVGCVGRLVDLKNHAAVLRAISVLGGEFPTTRLALIGDGPLELQLRMLSDRLGLSGRVQFLGERSDVPELLAGLDAFVLPSLTEGHSIALLEAAAAGLAIVATDVGGNPEIVQTEQTGLLVPPADDAAIAAALRRLICDRALSRALGAAARSWTLAHVSVPGMTDAYDAVYAEALQKR